MTIVFERPVGASADLKELEYISALHQTCSTELRQDASIAAADIRLFLRSRYGILVEEDELQKTVISGLGGGDSAEEIIDLMEVVCMLLIPTLIKAARVETDDDSHLSNELPEGVIPPEADLIKKVLTMMLEDVTGDATSKPLNERLVANLFTAYGEMDLAKDISLHKAMIQAANPTGRENAKLDVNTFSSGLITDIGEYDLKNEILLDNSLIDTYGIWLSDRLLSGNLAQYIVSIYVLVVGIQTSMYLVDEYSKEDAKKFIHNVTWNLFQPNDGFEDVESFMGTFTGYIGSYMAGEAGDCTNATILTPEEVESLCNITEGVYDCHEGASRDIFCTLAHSTYGNTTQHELSHQLALLAAAGFNVTGFEESAKQSIEDATNSSVDSLYPSSEYMIRIPLIVGTATAFITSVYLAVTFLPSITSTILQLRCGFIPTMANKDFNKYRCAPDQVSILTGSMFWGTLLGSFLVGSFVGVLVFLCLWQATVYYMAKLFAILGGILVIAIIRISVLSICRCKMYRAFYRERPFSANISLLALEWANFTLSVGFILVRIIKLIISACMFIRRIDTPFLAPKVGQLGPIELDNYPTIFMKDLLQHEAHRHPYIEMLGVLYLMKLRYRDSFGSKAGAAWRLLFVYSLLPWMHKYRIHVKGEVGFVLQGLAESTRGRMSILVSQRLSTEDIEEDDDESKVFRRGTSITTYQLERANMELKNRLDFLEQRERDLLATISDLEDKIERTSQTASPHLSDKSSPKKDPTDFAGDVFLLDFSLAVVQQKATGCDKNHVESVPISRISGESNGKSSVQYNHHVPLSQVERESTFSSSTGEDTKTKEISRITRVNERFAWNLLMEGAITRMVAGCVPILADARILMISSKTKKSPFFIIPKRWLVARRMFGGRCYARIV
ncbi:hypothetical protein IV203_033703 [Nitzschia inconspicua]|uniref:Uncharacterized protein n=1 Tax=Nitzschia inconspicua TaxID=303405 RepID=A0A9K3M2Q7_9STRA|nr:hypothetical protein IV203_033703 [Nitzschia inconspicua]